MSFLLGLARMAEGIFGRCVQSWDVRRLSNLTSCDCAGKDYCKCSFLRRRRLVAFRYHLTIAAVSEERQILKRIRRYSGWSRILV